MKADLFHKHHLSVIVKKNEWIELGIWMSFIRIQSCELDYDMLKENGEKVVMEKLFMVVQTT